MYDIPEKDAGKIRQYRTYQVHDGSELDVAVDYEFFDGEVQLWAVWYGSLNIQQFMKESAVHSLEWEIERELEAEARAMRAEMRAQIKADAWEA